MSLAALTGCPIDPSPIVVVRYTALAPAAPIASGVFVSVYGRADGIQMFRADPSPVGTWVSVDPGVVYPRLIATDPRRPRTVFTVGYVSSSSTTDRLRRSDDGGATWFTLLDSPNYLDRVTVDPHVADRVWLTQQGPSGTPAILRSDDDGVTFTAADAGLPQGQVTYTLTFDAAGSVRYVSLSDGKRYRADAPDGTFAEIPAPYEELVADPSVADRVYAFDLDGSLARSDDRGATWTNLPGGLQAVGSGAYWRANALAIDPGDPSRMYLAIRSAGVWRSDDGGQTFVPSSPGALAGETVVQVVVDPTDPTRILASSPYAGAFLSEDRGVSWRELDLSTAATEPFAGQQATP